MTKITTQSLIKMKQKNEKITALTCYSSINAKICNKAGIDILLVGDSLGNVLLGYDTTLPVTIYDMLYFTKIVSRINSNSLLITDMPFLSYQTSTTDAIRNAGRLIKKGGANAVKLEGGIEIIDKVKAIINSGIPVMGHLGLLPQSVNKTGGYKVQGKKKDEADIIIKNAKALEKAGVFSIVLECIPEDLGKTITEQIAIPTIGIGAGRYCSGQILVLEDMLGLTNTPKKKFVKQYENLETKIEKAIQQYKNEVKAKNFPAKEHTF